MRGQVHAGLCSGGIVAEDGSQSSCHIFPHGNQRDVTNSSSSQIAGRVVRFPDPPHQHPSNSINYYFHCIT